MLVSFSKGASQRQELLNTNSKSVIRRLKLSASRHWLESFSNRLCSTIDGIDDAAMSLTWNLFAGHRARIQCRNYRASRRHTATGEATPPQKPQALQRHGDGKHTLHESGCWWTTKLRVAYQALANRPGEPGLAAGKSIQLFQVVVPERAKVKA